MKRQPKNNQLEILLRMFEQLQNLFTSDDNEAQALRGSLKRLIDDEMHRNPTKIGKLKLALRWVLLCPSLISVKGREGYEWDRGGYN